MRSIAVVAIALAGTAHAETRPRYHGNVEASLLGAPGSLDPVTAQTHAEITVVDLVFDTLYRITPAGAQPHLAAGAADLDATKTKVTITLRKGVKFHDGSALMPADVAASLERARTGPARWALAPIASIAPVAAANGDAIELVLRAPIAELETLLALPQTAITRQGKPPAPDKAIGTGPFAIDALERQRKRIRLRAFEDHFNGRPYVDTLTLGWYDAADAEARKFEDGSSQLSARGTSAFAGAQPKFQSKDVEGPASLLVFIGFGQAHADITSDKAFRKALDLALARATLETVTSGERVSPARDPLPVEAGGAAPTLLDRNGDLTAAQKQLAAAAARVKSLAPDKLAQLKLEILVEDTRPDDREIAERVVRALDKLGLVSTIKIENATVFATRIARGQADLWIGQLAVPITSASLWWSAAFAAGNDPWALQQMTAGAIDSAAAQKQFADKLPIVPLMFRSVRFWHRIDVRGLVFDASGRPCFAEVHLFGEPARSRGKR